MAQVALVGASGNAGSRILKELVERGHQVTAIARQPEKISPLAGVKAVKGDAADQVGLAEVLKNHDAVVSAVPFSTSDPDKLIGAVEDSGVKRYLVVGGAGSLLVGPSQRVIDQPDFPDDYKPEASNGSVFLEKLQQAGDLEWTFLSPSAEFEPGERTGRFRLGKDELLVDKDGNSRISFEDYAIALADELEKPEHIRQRFTVGY
ncbi:NAD(P)-dependent oxidoreductase [Vreelandella sp. EE22]